MITRIFPFAQILPLPPQPPAENFLQTFPDLTQVSTDLAVVGTNLLLAILLLLMLLMATTVFNNTVKENVEALAESAVGNLAPGISRRFAALAEPHPKAPGLRDDLINLAKPLGVLAVTALIYAAIDPHFGFNGTTMVLLLALMGGLTLTTFLYEGGQVLFSARALRLPSALRLYPVALIIAVASVALSRLIDLHPGIIFGFVASAGVMARGGITKRHNGLIVFVPLFGLLLVSFVALVLVAPLRAISEGSTSVWAGLPETIAIAVFVGGSQSVLLTLVPVTFSDGQKVWHWSKWAWMGLAVPATFLFFHLVINRTEDFAGFTSDSEMRTLLIIAAILLAASLAVWAFFRLRARSDSTP